MYVFYSVAVSVRVWVFLGSVCMREYGCIGVGSFKYRYIWIVCR